MDTETELDKAPSASLWDWLNSPTRRRTWVEPPDIGLRPTRLTLLWGTAMFLMVGAILALLLRIDARGKDAREDQRQILYQTVRIKHEVAKEAKNDD